MSRDTTLVVVGGVIILALLVVAGLGAFGTTVTTSSSSSTVVALPDPASDGTSGVIFHVREEGRESILGITIKKARHYLHVGMIVPEHCVVTDDQGMESLSEAGECADTPARGDVSGGGTTPSGDRLIIVEVPVSAECFEAVETGDVWPPEAQACRTDAGDD